MNYEPPAHKHISEIAKAAVALANDCGKVVTFYFNGYPLKAYPKMDASVIVNEWQTLQLAKEKVQMLERRAGL